MAIKSLNSVGGFSVKDLNGNASIIIDSSGNVTTPDLVVTGLSNLGSVANIQIDGGLNGQVLSTDGAGNLSWKSSTGGGGGFFYVGTRTGNIQITVAMGNLIIGARSGNVYVPVV